MKTIREGSEKALPLWTLALSLYGAPGIPTPPRANAANLFDASCLCRALGKTRRSL
jgi:hypothetical protein